ncbi:hypothetical protein M011DRAFT_489418 [Sporormia fimetaria CBS 119925]|uniref:Uncharacterized protein n=1 Tax=Sporormia fimetaria CBS 119925 TaxID=1340428 RepID=A0A6A6V3X7_9PLEO|nr:hypothetical protein M011DRAFT_489418 [Sporormia fimetaria CBS 119925]
MLRFVNKQLYEETAGLELQYNSQLTVVGGGEARIPTARKFLSYARVPYIQKHLHCVKKIVLCSPHDATKYGKDRDTRTDFLELSDFCRHRPSVTVQYVFQSMTFSPEQPTMLSIHNMIRMRVLFRPLSASLVDEVLVRRLQEGILDRLNSWTRGRKRRRECIEEMSREDWHRRMGVANLRFFPNCTSLEGFESLWAEYQRWEGFPVSGFFEVHVKDWIENGF